MTRKYELDKRANSQEETRARIIAATVELHDLLGPTRTTITAIAERAGVQRLTVYRHFPDDRALFEACAGHWEARHPLPDLSEWGAVKDPEERLRTALLEIYAYFGSTEGMTGNLLRDLPGSSVLQEVATPFIEYWDTVREVLNRDWHTRGVERRLLLAVVGHAIEFETWRSLTRRQQLDDTTAADAMVSLARAIRR